MAWCDGLKEPRLLISPRKFLCMVSLEYLSLDANLSLSVPFALLLSYFRYLAFCEQFLIFIAFLVWIGFDKACIFFVMK